MMIHKNILQANDKIKTIHLIFEKIVQRAHLTLHLLPLIREERNPDTPTTFTTTNTRTSTT